MQTGATTKTRFHYKVKDSNDNILLNSELFEDFNGYETSDEAKRVANSKVKENKLDDYSIIIKPIQVKIVYN